jgi:hypothetical protein
LVFADLPQNTSRVAQRLIRWLVHELAKHEESQGRQSPEVRQAMQRLAHLNVKANWSGSLSLEEQSEREALRKAVEPILRLWDSEVGDE